jgi:hypothetical protein
VVSENGGKAVQRNLIQRLKQSLCRHERCDYYVQEELGDGEKLVCRVCVKCRKVLQRDLIAYRRHTGLWGVVAGERWAYSRRELEEIDPDALPALRGGVGAKKESRP